MSAAVYTQDEARRYKLAPLPDVPFIGAPASKRLRESYEAERAAYREAYPARSLRGL